MTTDTADSLQPSMFDNDEGKEETYKEELARQNTGGSDIQSPEGEVAQAPSLPDASLVTPPGEAESVPGVSPVPPPSALPDDTLRQELTRSQQESEQLRQQQQTAQISAQIDQRANQVGQQWIAEGYSEEQGRVAAQQQRMADTQLLQVQQNADMQNRELHAKMTIAMQYGEQYGVSAKELMRYNDPAAMHNAAKMEQRVQKLEKENTDLKQGRVPAQSMDASRPSAQATPSRSRKLDQFNNGDYSPRTDSEWAEINKLIEAAAE